MKKRFMYVTILAAFAAAQDASTTSSEVADFFAWAQDNCDTDPQQALVDAMKQPDFNELAWAEDFVMKHCSAGIEVEMAKAGEDDAFVIWARQSCAADPLELLMQAIENEKMDLSPEGMAQFPFDFATQYCYLDYPEAQDSFMMWADYYCQEDPYAFQYSATPQFDDFTQFAVSFLTSSCTLQESMDDMWADEDSWDDEGDWESTPEDDFFAWAQQNCDVDPQEALMEAMQDPNFDEFKFAEDFVMNHCSDGIKDQLAESGEDDAFVKWARYQCGVDPLEILFKAMEDPTFDMNDMEQLPAIFVQEYCSMDNQDSQQAFLQWADSNCIQSPYESDITDFVNFTASFLTQNCTLINATSHDDWSHDGGDMGMDMGMGMDGMDGMEWFDENCDTDFMEAVMQAMQEPDFDEMRFAEEFVMKHCQAGMYNEMEKASKDDAFVRYSIETCGVNPMELLMDMMSDPNFNMTQQEMEELPGKFLWEYCDVQSDFFIWAQGNCMENPQNYSRYVNQTNMTEFVTFAAVFLAENCTLNLNKTQNYNYTEDWDMDYNYTDDYQMDYNYTDDWEMDYNYTDDYEMDYNYTDDWDMSEDWDMEGDWDWDMEGDWNQTFDNYTDFNYTDMPDYQMPDYDYMYGDQTNSSSTDFVGRLFECQDLCEQYDCKQGVMCIVNSCYNECFNTSTCTQSYLQDWTSDWIDVDCVEGLVDLTPNCEHFCDYVPCPVDAAIDYSQYDVCWMEECEDDCGHYNCTIWFQDGSTWYGDDCPERDIEFLAFLGDWRPQDTATVIQEQVLSYNSTIQSIFQTFCPPGDQECLNGHEQLMDAFKNEPMQAASPDDLPVSTQELSDQITGFVGGAIQTFTDQVLPNISNVTDMFFTPAIQNLTNSFINTTQTNNPNIDLQALDTIQQQNSTDDVVSMFTENLNADTLVGLAQEVLGDDIDLSWFGVFTQGPRNLGQERKGTRV